MADLEQVESSVDDTNIEPPQEEDQQQEQCGLYLAISSTSTVDDTNWGIFVGNDITGIRHNIGHPEIGIIVSNLRLHNENKPVPKQSNIDLIRLVDYFEAFFWVPSTAGAKLYEHKNGRAIAAISGPGVLASYSKHMTNADWDPKSTYLRPLQNDPTEVSHPNRGAFSPYYHCQIVTTINTIKAGSEVFMEYGDSWGDKQNDDETLEKDDYEKIDLTVQQMIDFFNKYNDTLDDDSRIEIYSFLMKDIMKAAVGATKARRIASILPPDPLDLPLVPAAGGTLAYSDPTAHRSLSFLQKYGLCMDHIYPKSSTIPNIGRGAFAKHNIKKGNMIVPIPLTHIPEKAIFNMHPLKTDENGNLIRTSEEIISQQLIINYCFGHKESTMLFYPSGSMSTLINHSHKSPNAKLQWSTHPNHQKYGDDLDPITLTEEEYMYMGLILEVVALRDIEKDEEIFIDYGIDWEIAYQKHVQEWNTKIDNGIIPKTWPIRAVDLNTKYHYNNSNNNNDSNGNADESTGTISKKQPFPTKSEMTNENAFPENVVLMAFLLLKDTENAGTIDDPKLWSDDNSIEAYVSDNLYEISIIERINNNENGTSYMYTIEWTSKDEENNNSNKSVIVTNVPHDAILFLDKSGTSDQQYLMEHSFRHYIAIPDDIFPKGPWRNIKL